MFFAGLCLLFLFIGMFISMIDTFLPGFFFPVVLLGMRWIGVVLMWVGPLLYLGRSVQTGGDCFADLPNPNHTILINQGSSSTRIIKARKDILNTLVHRGKRFKDMGEAMRVAGHDVQISNEMSYNTYPVWLIDLISKYKRKYGVRTHEELETLWGQLKDIKTHEDLFEISELKPVLADEKRAYSLFDMSLDSLRNMEELVLDGRTLNIDAYKEWYENVTAYETETIINRTVDHRVGQFASYRFAGGVDWGKIVIPAMIILIMGAVAYQIFGGG